ncbi:unnamed protein product [Linum trigynum]|uniref:Uncharacterized protein n=1 Tax=Linum trigynum TaxID=586398 RepID=A0AAV2GSP5_9ROSI
MDASTNEELRRSLAKREIRQVAELEEKIQKAILMEEALGAKEEEQGSGSRRPAQNGRGEAPRTRRRSPDRRDDARRPNVCVRRDVLANSQEPRRDRTNRENTNQPRGQADMYCEYHNSRTHNTVDCHYFKKALKIISDRGGVREMFQKAEQGNRSPRERSRSPAARPPVQERLGPNPNVKEIRTITGGEPNRKKKCKGQASDTWCMKIAKQEGPDLSFTSQDYPPEGPSENPLVINIQVEGYKVFRVLVDSGSSADILFYSCWRQMQAPPEVMKASEAQLVGFSGAKVKVLGTARLRVKVGDEEPSATHPVDFHIADCASAYNAILGRPFLARFGAVASTCHQAMKFQTPQGMGIARGDAKAAKACYAATIHKPKIHTIDARPTEVPRPGAVDSEIELPLDPDDPSRVVRLSAHLPEHMRLPMINLLREYADLFAWSPEDMPGVSRDLMEHKLSVKPESVPVQQKRRGASLARRVAMMEEVQKLLKAGFIREVQYPKWLANTVLVKKHNGTWRMCIDFTSLNKACPKDPYPLPRIDQLVDATSNHEMLSFLDMFSGYHQIPLSKEDQEKTTFMTPYGNYCYIVMPFGLKNAGATYHRMVDKVFGGQIGRNVEAYVDDVLIKIKKEGDHLSDLRETFENLRRHNMKLNPLKCVFGAGAGQFLGFMITRRGIEANPKQIKAIAELKSPRTVKEVQGLAGKLAALNRFIPRSADRCAPLFNSLKKKSKFKWTEACEKAFEEMKTLLVNPPILVAPQEGERLFLYIAISDVAISAVLVRRHSETLADQPVYYISKTLLPTERRYPIIEKAALALVTAAQKLRPYFQGHTVTVLTNLPMKRILHSTSASGRLTKWAVELSEFDIQYASRPSIKAQILADFLAEGTIKPTGTDEGRWKLFVDGAASKTGAGAGIILETPGGVTHEVALRFSTLKTNNAAEYEALINGMRIAEELGARRLDVFSNSALVVRQVLGEFEVKEDCLLRFVEEAKKRAQVFEDWKLSHIARGDNAHADALSKLATAVDFEEERHVIFEKESPSTPGMGVNSVNVGKEEQDWRVPIVEYLMNDTLPTDPKEATGVRRRAARCTIIGSELHRRSYEGVYLRCLGKAEAKWALREIHEGVCGGHGGPRSLERTLKLQGYYWPTMRNDAKQLAMACHACQTHAKEHHLPATAMQGNVSPWPFAQWGMDLVGPFPKASGKRKYLIVAVDYFTKWIEAEPLATITAKQVERFVFNNILAGFGIPNSIVTDHGKQFDCTSFADFCQEYNIQLKLSSVAYPEANGQAEAANKTILQGLKKRLQEHKGNWVEELPHVLWALRTTPKSSTGETPFALTFGAEAVTPTEVALPTLRVQYFNEGNNVSMAHELDMLDERRVGALRKLIEDKEQLAKYYNSKLKPHHIEEGDLVLRKVFRPNPNHGKLAAKWEGPFVVREVIGPSTFKLATMEAERVSKTLNARHLRKYVCEQEAQEE